MTRHVKIARAVSASKCLDRKMIIRFSPSEVVILNCVGIDRWWYPLLRGQYREAASRS